ncbi:MAG TPA: N-acetylmuramoyl-L-alanine amidase [Trebonia sp.]|nr:N-acetylmuramoyl-L-alanine amidase [Trebonia sp.]
MSLKRVWIGSPNYSSRGGSAVRLIVLHTSEGAQTYQSLGSYFQGPVEASSHTGIDNAVRGTIGEYVKRGNKAWTQANANPSCVSAELCTPAGAAAGWSRDYWLNQQRTLLDNAADWVAEEAAAFGIPIVGLSDSQAQGGGRGVCQHMDLGSWGGGHSDCGGGFPIDYVLDKAAGGGGEAAPIEPEQEEEEPMLLTGMLEPGETTTVPFPKKSFDRVMLFHTTPDVGCPVRCTFHSADGPNNGNSIVTVNVTDNGVGGQAFPHPATTDVASMTNNGGVRVAWTLYYGG